MRDVDAMIDAIRRLAVRGAPAIGVAGGFAVALAAQRAGGRPRPGVRARRGRAHRGRPPDGGEPVVGGAPGARPVGEAPTPSWPRRSTCARRTCREPGARRRGADLLESLRRPPLRMLTHCNTGGLACVEWGTALGIVRALHERGSSTSVIADETRPLLQGSRITAYELEQHGIGTVVVDGAGPTVIARGKVDAVIVGADRVAANGDVANKIGT